MNRFLKIPEMRWVSTKVGWQLTTELVFLSHLHGRIVVPAGFQTNLASVPRLPLIHLWTGGRANMPAVLHDFLYGCCATYITRKQADQVFLEAMRAINEPGNEFTRRVMHAGVRLGGRSHWRKVSCADCTARKQ